jgi:hypothetical protein
VLTHSDRDRLRKFIDAHERRLAREQEWLASLSARVDSANVVEQTDIERDCVTLYSQIRLRDIENGRSCIVSVAVPIESHSERSFSGAYPNASLVGARVGEIVLSPCSAGQARVEEVLFRPQDSARPGARRWPRSNFWKKQAPRSRATAEHRRQPSQQYDPVDRRLMDTFPASDAVARY